MSEVLYIKTPLKETRWLEYIMNAFKSVHAFKAKIVIVSPEVSLSQDAAVIVYARDFSSGVSIVERSFVLPQGDVLWMNEEVYVLPGTITPDERFALPYDLFWNAFVFLSGLEEWLLHQQGRIVFSHSALHPRRDKKSFLVPVVNVLFSRLEKVIRDQFPQLEFGKTSLAVIDFSHDVDYLSKSPVFMFKQSVLNVYDLYCSVLRPSECWFSFKKMLKFLVSRPSFWCFDTWRKMEEGFGVRSVFYIHAKARHGFLTTFIDPDYDLSRHLQLQDALKTLVGAGFTVGLHGSFYSAKEPLLLEQEKMILKRVLGLDVRRSRQHWLRFVHGVTPRAHQALFDVDSTLGWNDAVGYRNGCASAFHPYDHENQCAFTHLEIPQVIMDFNVFQSIALEDKDHVRQAKRVMEYFYQCKSAHVSISWHQQTCSPDYGWDGYYQGLLKEYAAKHVQSTREDDGRG